MVLNESTNYIEREVELANAIFCLASRDFVRVFEQQGRLGNTMPILSHQRLPLLRLKLGVQFSDHFACYPFILDVRIAVGKTTSLLPKLSRGHLDFTGPLNEFL
jgi:hypothetical protein